ncbi:MAG: M48 family metallopeptidase [Betaproteobacteria bacterium]|nr:M48 family metallopeptidase [Betaproteobacteria bacterium]
MTATWAATRFDGRSGAGEIVAVAIDGGVLRLASRQRVERYRLAELRIAESFEHAPTMVVLPGGATLEIRDPERTLGAALAVAGLRPSLVVRLQRNWAAALACLVVLVGLLAWGYVNGLPLLARAVTSVIPADVERRMGESVLEVLDARSLKPSGLPLARSQAIARAFAAAAARSAPGVAVRLEFRAGPANAFALPGGAIVLFDGLVKTAESDDEVLGALGHELGHVVHRHSTRQFVQVLGVAAVASLLWGDFSSVAANAPLLMGAFRYGREFEREADEYAIAFMRDNGMPVEALDSLFARLEKERGAGLLPDFATTHPSTAERRERVRDASRGGSPTR